MTIVVCNMQSKDATA
jgi:hypothetical protein